MKKWKILSGLIMSFIAAQTVVFAAECTNPPVSDSSCPSDSTFYGRLRFGHKYAFDDYFYAKGGTNELWGFDAYVKEQCNYNNSAVEQEDGFFDYSSDILNRNYLMPARTQPYWIIASNEYSVYKKPAQRNDRNLLVKYNVYYTVNGGSEKTHTECKYYAISWCGDGVLDVAGSGDSWESEQCDPNDPNKTGWGDGGCSADCKPVKKGACSSTYNGQRVTTLSGGNHLCKEGTYSSFYHDTLNHKWTWKCNNSLGNGEECSATEPYCGDGIKDSGEKCDPGDTVNKTGWGNGGCDKVTCTPINVGDPLCNSQYNGQRLDSLTEGDHLCTEGKYSEFKYHESLHKWTWKCKNSLGNGVDCSAVKPYCGDGVKDPGEECDGSDDCSDTCKIMYCGDGIKNNGEECDPKDPTKAGWGPDGCNQFCEPKFNPDVSCTQTFKRILRCGKSYNFPDDFKAGGTDQWMYSFSVNFKEGSDLNGGANPTFLWTDVLKNNNMLVKAGQTMTIIDSTPKYNIKNCPTTRSYENLYIEYTVTTAAENPNGQELPNAKLSTHKECIYYAVSRCGDGVLDTDDGEECDPGSAGTSTLPDGRICNSDCKIEDVPSTKGKPGIEKTLKDKIPVEKVGQTLKWTVKVTAKGGDVTDFEIKDFLPEVLDYVSYKVTSNQDSLTVKNPTGPVKDGKNNVYTWDVKGTLKENHTLELEIETKVNKMPKSNDDYKNVACVIDDGQEDCDQDIPDPKGKPKISKTLKDKIAVEKVGQTLKWTVRVTAEGGSITDFEIKDLMPEVLDYVSYKVTSNQDSLTVKNPTGPVKDGKNNVYTWDVKGTLKENHTLELEIETKVNKMPKSNDDYLNVACVINDDDQDCDQDIPDPKGKAKIKKTLKDKILVEKVGQTLKWTVLVKAEGGNVTDFEVWDLMPEALDYVNYKVISNQDNLTVKNPTGPVKSGANNVYTWDVKGTLKENHTLELEIETKVNKMPKSDDDLLNIACVIDDDTKDCAQDKPRQGSLEPEKTLVGSKEVKKVGDKIVWNLRVTAKGGDFENPVMSDILPPVLGYSGYIVTNKPTGITISAPIFGTEDSSETVKWEATGILKENDYIEIQLTTYAKVMPDKEYDNVLCVRPKDKPQDKICDDVPIPSPKLRIKKSFSDGSKEKTVKVGDTIEYKITFGNKGTASATITSVKDFLPKNVEYVSSEIHITGSSNHTNNPSGSDVIYSNKKVDGVYIDIYGGITLEPGTEGYILLKGKILSDNKDNRTNFACIYLNDKKPDDSIIDGDRCDDAVHNFEDGLLCKAPEITKKSFTTAGGSTTVVCKTSNGTGNIELSCGDGATLSGSKASILTGSNISSLTGTCVYPKNTGSSSKSYSVVCKVNGETGDSCKDTVSVEGTSTPSGLSCKAPEITKKSFTTAGGSTTVVCKTSNGKTADIELSCGDGATLSGSKASILTGSNISSLTGTCVYPKNSGSSSKSYSIVCKVNGETDDKCKDKVTISGSSSSCFVAGTKVTMADGSKKNIEDIEIGEKILGQDGSINTVLGYDRPSLGNRHLWSINGSEYFVSDEHPFMTTQGWKSFNPEMTKLEIDLDTTELKVGDTMITENGRVKVDTVDYIDAADNTQLYNFVLDGNHTYYANSYLVHNKGGGSCFVAGTKVVMADGTQKNIEDVEIGEKIMGENGVNTVLGYDRPILRSRHLWSINGGEYFVSDEHPFKTTHGWKSFNPEMTKLEIDLDTTELKVGDIMITRNGLEMVKTVDYIDADYNTQLYNFVLDGDHTYHANGYLVHNKGGETTCFTAGTKVTMADGTKKNIEDVKIGEKIMGKDGLNTVLGYDRPSLGNRHLWSINGGRYFVSDEHPFMTTEGWKSFNPEMTKQEIDLNTTELKVGDIMITENGTLKVETVDYINAEYSTQLYNFILDGDHTYYADGYLVHNKGGGPTPDPIIAPMAECFDINANQLSYEQGEILPFYWNLDNLSKDDIWYLSGSFSDKVKAGEKCDGNAEGLVALNSMECSYDIVDSDGIVKKTGSFPCLTEENFTVNPFYQSRLDIGKNKMCGTSNNKCYFDFTTKATKTRLWSKLNHIENFGAGWTRFGEYKIRMKKISYLRCNDGEWDSKEKSGESLCESTFMLTNPYTVQKTPSGNFRASTEALSNYRYCEKYEEVRDTNVKPKCLSWNNADKLLNAIAVSEYQPNKAVDDAMQKFINKYSKLAVSTGKNGLKKVPGKNIYFISQNICLGSKCTNDIKLNKPTTLVQTSGDVEIKGDVNTDNLMLLTNGKIKFTDPDSCTHRQVVKGIFYAKSGIERTPVQKNTSDRATKRCTEGGLTVKGVLIGNGLQQVMKNSRSNLNNWHHSKTAQTVMNGASVLIEYSPSVFTKSTMPPGAEDFTTALSIYKD